MVGDGGTNFFFFSFLSLFLFIFFHFSLFGWKGRTSSRVIARCYDWLLGNGKRDRQQVLELRNWDLLFYPAFDH
ncbi:hypothetical protein CI102_254 [Trichoderma harzianum]|nr:hypothetical protein CI102_254 [Trichoderma harzianum]